MGVKNSNALVEALGKSIGHTATKDTNFKDQSKQLEKQKVKTVNKYPGKNKVSCFSFLCIETIKNTQITFKRTFVWIIFDFKRDFFKRS